MAKKKSTSKPSKKSKSALAAVKKIDNMEFGYWMFLTMCYILLVGILYGWTTVNLPEIVYWWGVPVAVQYMVWIAGITFWVPVSMVLYAYFKNHRVRVGGQK
jgi:hypothetical protein